MLIEALDYLRDFLNLLSIIRLGFSSYAFVGKVVASKINLLTISNDPDNRIPLIYRHLEFDKWTRHHALGPKKRHI